MLEIYGVGGILGRAVRSLHESSQVCVRVLGQILDWFMTQGCVMSL